MRKNNILIMFIVAILFILNLFDNCLSVEASNIDKNYLHVTSYEITNETIEPGKDFTFTVYITNYSKRYAANNVVVSVKNPDGVIPAYGSISIEHVDVIAPSQTESVSFYYKANSSIKGSEVDFAVSVSSNECTSGTSIRVQVGKKNEFDVKEYYMPKEFISGKDEVLSAYIENIGLSAVNNVVMKVLVDGMEASSTNIGTMSVGTTKTEYVDLSLLQVGTYNIDLLLSYTATDGTQKEYIITSNKVNVIAPYGEEQTEEKTEQDNSKMPIQVRESMDTVVLACVSGILLITVLCVILLIMYRRK